MNFAEAIKKETIKKYTDNGHLAYSSTLDPLLDMYGSIGSMRGSSEDKIVEMLSEAFKADTLLATKMMFYTRDIRGGKVGKGERDTFRTMIKWYGENYPEIVQKNIHLIGEYGRYDDLYCLVGTKAENVMWKYIEELLNTDYKHMTNNIEKGSHLPVSLLAKWLKSVNSSSKESRKLGKLTAKKLGMTEKSYRKGLSALRKYLNVVEVKMSNNKWTEINYEGVPSYAMKTYRNAFRRHDEEGFEEFLSQVASGEKTIHSGTMYPYDIVGPFLSYEDEDEDIVLEEQWKALPNYIEGEHNILVMCDVSGSMTCSVNGVYALPLKTAIGLSIYFAERNTGAYKDMFMTFSERPDFVKLKGDTLREKVRNAEREDWGYSTDMNRAFCKILDMAIENNISKEEMPKALIVISDMQINSAFYNEGNDFYKVHKKRFEEAGYTIPKVIFWNVNASRPTFLTTSENFNDVLVVSGMSSNTFAEIIEGLDKSAEEMMLDSLYNPRYDMVTV